MNSWLPIGADPVSTFTSISSRTVVLLPRVAVIVSGRLN